MQHSSQASGPRSVLLALISSCCSWASNLVRNQDEKRQTVEAWTKKGTTGASGPFLTRTLIGLLVRLLYVSL